MSNRRRPELVAPATAGRRSVAHLSVRARSGNSAALEALQEQYLPMLTRLAGALVGDPRRAREVARTAMRVALGTTGEGPYLTAAVRAVQEIAANGPEDRAAGVPALDGVEDVGRLVLVLIDLDGHSVIRTGELLGLTPEAVRAQHRRARDALGVPATTSTCRGWLLVSRRDHLTDVERDAVDGHLRLCRPCREELQARAAVRRRLSRVLPVAVAAGGVSGLLGSAPAALVPLAVGVGVGVLGLGAVLWPLWPPGSGSAPGDRAPERRPPSIAIEATPGAGGAGSDGAGTGSSVAALAPRGGADPAVAPPSGRSGVGSPPISRLVADSAPTVVSLTDDAAGVAAFSAASMVPGQEVHREITVGNDSRLALEVRLYGQNSLDEHALGEHLLLKIGTNAGADDVFSGTVSTFAVTRVGFATGTRGVRLPAGQKRTYFLSVRLERDTPAWLQGTRARLDFVWEGREVPR